MKIEEKQHNVVSNINVGDSVKAKLGKSAIIADLLRKHYSNIKKTMIQEYISNARDAHRESGVAFNEIHVSLPNKRSPFLEIRDFGTTMTEDRLFNNFINYGESTKKDSDEQTGGFGIGSKIAYAYTHTFYLILFKDGFEHLYQASSVNEPLGELTLVYKKESNQKRGFSVRIPIAEEDFSQIHSDFYKITYYWEEQIKIVNLVDDEISSTWKNKKFFKTDNFIFDLSETNLNLKDYILIDSIPYYCPRVSSICQNIGVPFFKTGEIKVAINREQIVADEFTVRILNEKAIKNYVDEETFLKNTIIESFNLLSLEEKRNLESPFISYFKLHIDASTGQVMTFVEQQTVHTNTIVVSESKNKFKVILDFSTLDWNIFSHEQNKTNRNYRLRPFHGFMSRLKINNLKLFIKDVKMSEKEILKYKNYPKCDFYFLLIEPNDEKLKNFKQFIELTSFSSFIKKQDELKEKELKEYNEKQVILEQKRKEQAEIEAKKKVEIELKIKKEEEERVAKEQSIDRFSQYTVNKHGTVLECHSRKTKGFFITKNQFSNLLDDEIFIVRMEMLKNNDFFIINDISFDTVIQNPNYQEYKLLIVEKSKDYEKNIELMSLVLAARNFSYKGRKFYERTGDIPRLLSEYIPNLTTIDANMYGLLNEASSMLSSRINQINEYFESQLEQNPLFMEMYSKKFWDSTKESIIEFFFVKQLELYLKEKYCYIESNNL
jgi:hypothetical protein